VELILAPLYRRLSDDRPKWILDITRLPPVAGDKSCVRQIDARERDAIPVEDGYVGSPRLIPVWADQGCDACWTSRGEVRILRELRGLEVSQGSDEGVLTKTRDRTPVQRRGASAGDE
jgi:hypothetical protein